MLNLDICMAFNESEFRIHNPNANNVKWFVFVPTAEMRRRAKDQESRSRTHPCKDHACRSHGYKSQGPIYPTCACMHHARAKYIYPSMQSQEPRAMQGPRAKEQEPKTKSQRPRVTRTMSQGPCRSHAMDQEPRTKSQGPRDQPIILRYSGQPPTDLLKQILITQKMYAALH